MIFLYSWDHNKLVHVLSNVRAEFCRNDVWKYQPSSKVRLHLPGSCSRKSRRDFWFGGFSTDVASTSLTKLMNFFSSFHPLFFFLSFSGYLLSTWLCLHLYLPCSKQTLYDDKTCTCPVLNRHCMMTRHMLKCLFFIKAHSSCFLLGSVCISWLVYVTDHTQILL